MMVFQGTGVTGPLESARLMLKLMRWLIAFGCPVGPPCAICLLPLPLTPALSPPELSRERAHLPSVQDCPSMAPAAVEASLVLLRNSSCAHHSSLVLQARIARLSRARLQSPLAKPSFAWQRRCVSPPFGMCMCTHACVGAGEKGSNSSRSSMFFFVKK